MLRKYHISSIQKDKIERIIKTNNQIENAIHFEQTDEDKIFIVSMDEDYIKRIDEMRKEFEVKNNRIIINKSLLLSIYNIIPYRELREIKDNFKPGYRAIDIGSILKETEKAYYIKILNSWIGKTQTFRENNTLYVKDWIVRRKIL